MTSVTQILASIEHGDLQAADKLLPLVYDELRLLAAGQMAQEKPGQTLQATALVHEAYLRLVGRNDAQHWEGRRHFFGAAAEAMRRILIESARRRNRIKRGGQAERLPLEDLPIACPVAPDELLALDEAIQKLASVDAAAAELVRLRFFAGLNHAEAAGVLGVSEVTVKRLWRYGRAWLHREIQGESPLPHAD